MSRSDSQASRPLDRASDTRQLRCDDRAECDQEEDTRAGCEKTESAVSKDERTTHPGNRARGRIVKKQRRKCTRGTEINKNLDNEKSGAARPGG